jgi:integrase/recombinase XerD
MAYYRAVTEFFAWVERHKIGQLADIEPLHARMAKPTVKQHLAAVRMCFDWLVTGGILVNPAHAGRGPKHVVKRGKTPVLTTDGAGANITKMNRHGLGSVALAQRGSKAIYPIYLLFS